MNESENSESVDSDFVLSIAKVDIRGMGGIAYPSSSVVWAAGNDIRTSGSLGTGGGAFGEGAGLDGERVEEELVSFCLESSLLTELGCLDSTLECLSAALSATLSEPRLLG